MAFGSRVLLLSWISLALAPALLAQTTWNGLRFGISKDAAVQFMQEKGYHRSGAGDEVPCRATCFAPEYELQLPGTVKPFPFAPEFNFDSTGLSVITLNLDTKKYLENVVGGSIYAAVTIADKRIHDALVIKYGQSVSADGPCGTVTVDQLFYKRHLECVEKWRGESQMVTVTWTYQHFPDTPATFYYFIEYKPGNSNANPL